MTYEPILEDHPFLFLNYLKNYLLLFILSIIKIHVLSLKLTRLSVLKLTRFFFNLKKNKVFRQNVLNLV